MKELSIEQKTKAYDEALKVAEKYHNGILKDVMETIFPELKESEDEEIRKFLIQMAQNGHGEDRDWWNKCVAWLEKQCEKTSVDIDNKFIKMRETKPKDISEFLDRLTTVEQEFLWEHIAKIRELDKEEQKPTEVEPKFKIEEGKWYICIFQFCNCIEGRVYKATSDSRIMDDFGTEYDMHNDAYKYFRLWTIQDAMDGDVLKSGEQLFLFKRMNTSNSFYAHCSYHFIGYDSLSVYDCSYSIDNIYPATKEQRNTLMKAMTDAGYTFDFEKKELKKIERKPWSEEDEKCLKELTQFFENLLDCVATEERHKENRRWLNWLKSLRPQTQWKPSEEQMIAINTAINVLGKGTLNGKQLIELQEDLKKLKG